MALSVAQYAQVADWFALTANGGNKTVTGLAWSAGDAIVVIGGCGTGQSGAGAVDLNVPTNANLTFTPRTILNAHGNGEAIIYIWTAFAATSQSAQTITSVITINDAASQAHGIGVWVITGSPSGGIWNVNSNYAETAFSLTTFSGSVVVFGLMDFNATNPPGKTPLTGSGTPTERRDAGDGANYAQWLAEWVGTTASTATFGPNNYTSLQVTQAIIEITNAGVFPPTPGVWNSGVRRG